MKKIKNIIELDVDGVLLDIYTPVEKYLSLCGIDFRFERDASSYSLDELGDLRNPVKKALTDADMRCRALFYDGAVDFLTALCQFADDNGLTVLLHTSEYNAASAAEKKKKLDYLQSKTHISFDYIIEKGDKIMLPNTLICIDDSVDNLKRSNAPIKILYAQFHNKEYPDDMIRVESYENLLAVLIVTLAILKAAV